MWCPWIAGGKVSTGSCWWVGECSLLGVVGRWLVCTVELFVGKGGECMVMSAHCELVGVGEGGMHGSAHSELVGVGEGGMHASAQSELVGVGEGGMQGSAHELLSAGPVAAWVVSG